MFLLYHQASSLEKVGEDSWILYFLSPSSTSEHISKA
jgi:hypothetical protein